MKAARRAALGLHRGNQDRNMTFGFISLRFLVPADLLGGLGQVTSTLLPSIYSPSRKHGKTFFEWRVLQGLENVDLH